MGSPARRAIRLVVHFIVVAALLWLPSPVSLRLVGAPDVPVVFIPGFAGSKLVGPDGQLLWGDVASVLQRFERLDFRASPPRAVKASGVLDAVGVLGPFSLGQYAGLLKTLEALGYQQGKSLITFPYDWRQSNADTARQFQAFVESRPELRGRKFDVVAHSMGGLVALLYLHDHNGATRVRRLITMGTPYKGSLEALRTAVEGIQEINVIAGTETVRRVFTSFPALFELMPTYQHCCYRTDGKERTPVVVSARDSWRTFRWLDDIGGGSVQAADTGLKTAARISELTEKPLPGDTVAFRLAGGGIATLSQVLMKNDGRVERWAHRPGDGTVLELSAAQFDLKASAVSLRRHSTIFEDDVAKTWLRRVLTEPGALSEKFSDASQSFELLLPNGETNRQVASVRLSLRSQIVTPETPVQITLELFDGDDLPLAGTPAQDVSLIDSSGGAPERIRLVQQRDGVFSTTIPAPPREGAYLVRWQAANKTVEEQFFYVAAR